MTDSVLADLAREHGADKLEHGYCRWYEEHLAARRHEPLRLLEIGVGGYGDPAAGGAGLRMWRDYLPDATIVGLDVHHKELDLGERVTIAQGSQADAQFLTELHAKHGPFDVVIDDGSHFNPHRNFSFECLFPLLADEGLYVMEDMHTSYLREFYRGNNRPQAGPNDPPSSMELVKGLVDGLNHQYIPNWRPGPFDAEIVGVYAHPKIVFVRKGRNSLLVGPIDRAAIDAEAGV